MNAGFRLRFAGSVSLIAVLFLFLAFFGTTGATAAQIDQATPIEAGQPGQDHGESPDLTGLSDDDTIAALALSTVSFSAESYTAQPRLTATISVTYSFTGPTSATSFFISYPINPLFDGYIIRAPVATGSTGVSCSAAIDDGGIGGSVSTTGDGTCTITFDIVPIDASVGSNFTMEAQFPAHSDVYDTATFTVVAPPTAVFNATPYYGAAGSTVSGSVTFSFTYPATVPYAISPPPGWTLENVVNSGSSGSVTCPESASGSFTISTAPASCTYTFDIVIPPDADSTNPNYVIAAFAGNLADALATASITVNDITVTASFDQTGYSAFPGQTTSVTLTVGWNAPWAGGTIIVSSPDPGLVSVISPLTTIPPDCLDGAPLPTFGDSLHATIPAKTTAGSCALTFSMQVSGTAPAGPIAAGITSTIPDLETDPTATFTVDAIIPPTAAFDAPAYSAKPGAFTTGTFTITYGDFNPGGAFTIVNPDPTHLQYSIASVLPGGGGPCVSGGIDINGNITGTSGAPAGGGTCTIGFAINVDPAATPGPLNDLTATVAGLAPDPVAGFTVLVPAAPTAAFDSLAYSGFPGETVAVTLTITFTDPYNGGGFTIFNPDPAILTFSAPSFDNHDGVTGASGTINSDGDLDMSITALAAGHTDVQLALTIAGNATAGPVGNLAATLPGGNPVVPAAVSVLQPLTVQSTTLSLNAGETISGDLSDQVSGGTPPYHFAVQDEPQQGSLVLNGDGTFTYTANPDASGNDIFTYSVTDSGGVTTVGAAVAEGSVSLLIAAATPTATAMTTSTATATATASVTSTATSTPTEPATGPSPTATERPVIPGHTPTATAISGDGTSGGTSGGNVTQLPSTGAANAGNGSDITIALLVLAVILLGCAWITRSRHSQ